MRRRDFHKKLLLASTAPLMLALAAKAQSCSQPLCYPQSAAELAANVMPVDYSYPPGDVRRYGGDPTGKALATSAVQDALNVAYAGAGVVIIGQECNYLCGAVSLTMADNHSTGSLTIVGASVNGSRLTLDGSSGTFVTIQGANPTGAPRESQFVMRNLTLSGATGADGLLLDGVAYWLLENVYIMGFNRNLYLNSALSGCIRNCGFFQGNYGIYARADGTGAPPNLVRIRDSLIEGNANWGIDYDQGSHLILESCDIEGNGTSGDSSTGAVHIGASLAVETGFAVVRIIGCWLEANSGQSIKMDNTAGQVFFAMRDTWTLSEEIFEQGSGYIRYALTIDNCQYVDIENCTSPTNGSAPATWTINATNLRLCNVLPAALDATPGSCDYVNVNTSNGPVISPSPYAYRGSTPSVGSGVTAGARMLPASSAATYIVSATVAGVNDAYNCSSVAIVSVNGGAANITTIQSAPLLSITLSGLSVELTQSSGASLPMQYAITQIA